MSNMDLAVGSVLEGKVTGITNFGAFVELGEGKTGMVHISEVAATYVKEIRDHIEMNQQVKVKVLSIGEDGKISLSIKRALVDFDAQEQRPGRNFPPRNNAQRSGPPRNSAPRSSAPRSSAPRSANTWNGTPPQRFEPDMEKGSASFEDMMSKFKKTSDDKMSDLKRFMDVKKGSANRRSNNK